MEKGGQPLEGCLLYPYAGDVICQETVVDRVKHCCQTEQ